MGRRVWGLVPAQDQDKETLPKTAQEPEQRSRYSDWLDDRGIGVRVPVGSRISTSPYRPDRLCGPPNLLSNGYRGLFPRG
jgi:hypothetical protein